jgi:uncharacterized protein
LVGSALLPALRQAEHEAVALVRRPAQGASELQWNPATPNPALFAGADAVVNLSGESIAAGRWTAARKAAILNSRVLTTQTVAASIAAANPRPRVLVSASAVGFYGSRNDEVLDETSSSGGGFLAEVGRQWEAATQAAATAGVRVVNLRIGVVLSGAGGALPRMLTPFRFGLGGRIGDGRQWMSWIVRDDLVALLLHALATDSLRGPVNAVTPNPVTNADFTRALGQALHRPTLFPMPAFAVRAAFGEMGTELLLGSQRVLPRAALASGFRFWHPELGEALEWVLRK